MRRLPANPATFSVSDGTTGCPSGSVGKFSFDAVLTNTSKVSLVNLQVEIAKLTGQNYLQLEEELIQAGGRFGIPAVDNYSDGVLSSKESVDIAFVVCLGSYDPFQLFVNLFGQSY